MRDELTGSAWMSGPASAFYLVDDYDANLVRWLHPQPAQSAPDPAVAP